MTLVNSYYPSNVPPPPGGPAGSAQSRPLSQFYSTIAQARAAFPKLDFAFQTALGNPITLNDEVDWCALQSAFDDAYHAGIAANGTQNNWSFADLVLSGNYMVSRTITNNCLGARLQGGQRSVANSAWWGATSISYGGPAGTVDAPVYILDNYVQTETGAAAPGRVLNTAQDPSVTIERVNVYGQFGNMRATTPSAGYVSGVRIRKAVSSRVSECLFGGTLWDGLVASGPQQLLRIERNNFYGCFRDGLSVCANQSNFSTTLRIVDNEFGYVGRYALLLDLSGSVESMPLVEGNDFEQAFQSYFINNPGWFVHGLPAGMCIINGGNLRWERNRTEGIILTPGFLAELHLVNCVDARIVGSILHTVALTAHASSPSAGNAALLAYEAASGFSDITNFRNYNVGSHGNFVAQTQNLYLRDIYGLAQGPRGSSVGGGLVVADNTGLDQGQLCTASECQLVIWSYPVNGTVINASAVPIQLDPNAYNIAGHSLISAEASSLTNDPPFVSQQTFLKSPPLSARLGHDGVPELALYQDQIAFRFGNYASSWPAYKGWTINRLAADMTKPPAGWFLDAPLFYASIVDASGVPIGNFELAGAVITTRKIRYNVSALPTSGGSVGDICYYTNPASGGYVGAVCVTPGTWKNFGLIA